MSKKALFNIPVSEGGFKPEPVVKETIKPEVHQLTSDQDLDNDGVLDTVDYMSVADYSHYIGRPTQTIYRMIKDGQLESIKIKGKIHVVLDYKA